MEVTCSEELLQRLKLAYTNSVGSHRDSMLEIGQLLHEFVLARLHEADGLTKWKRHALEVTRAKAVKTAAEALGTERREVLRLIIGAAVAALLAPAAGLGRLSLFSVVRFGVFVQRRAYDPKEPSASETWEIKPELEQEAREAFGKAVAEEWSQTKVMEFIRKRDGDDEPNKRSPYPVDSQKGNWQEQARKAAGLASSGDVARMVLELVEAAEDRYGTALLLQAKLAQLLGRRRVAV